MQSFLFGMGFLLLASMAYAAYRGAPWVPTRKHDLDRLLRLADLKEGERFVELGCGTGHVCDYVARNTSAHTTGVELSFIQWLIAKVRANKTHVVFGDVFHHDLSSYDVVYLFLMPDTYHRMREKFERELKPGSRVITYVWAMPDWEPAHIDVTEGRSNFYVYRVGG